VGEVLAGFSANMRDLFAAQMKDSGDLLRQTNDAVAATGERQAEMNRQMSAFAAQVQATATESQARSADMLERALARLGEQVTTAVGRLQEQNQTSARVQEEQIGRLADRSLEVNHSVRGALETLSTASTDAISELNAGAARLAAAATDFARAGHSVAETMDAAAMATASIHSATDVLQKAATATQDMLAAHARNQETFAALAAELRTTVDTARREASLNATLIDGLQAAAAQLGAAQRKSEEFLRSVNDVLVEAHLSFADNVERSLREGNRQFHVELAQAVGLLSGAIQDLGDLVDNLPATLNRPRSAS
jgi:ABC-type transporter Mla subunit MlaD